MTRSKLIFLLALLILVSNVTGKQISDKLSIDFSERFRYVYWDNAIDLSDYYDNENKFTRYRTSIGSLWQPNDKIDFRLKITNEFRHYYKPDNKYNGIDEFIFDQLYLKFKKIFNYPVSLTIGRQNIILGEGFIMMDGGPLDGSRSIYFNAIRLDWAINKYNQITAFYTNQQETDELFPIINDQNKKLVSAHDEGFGINYTSKFYNNLLDIYFIRKNYIYDRDDFKFNINALGLRLKYNLSKNLIYTIEGNFQTGRIGTINRNAFGGYTYLNFKPKYKKQYFFLPYYIEIGGIYLSGDDRSTDKREGWDPMFARWPKWSESYIYTLGMEEGIAYWTNLKSIFTKLDFRLNDNINFTFDYHHLMASQKPINPILNLGGDGSTRGDLFISKLTYKLDNSWSGHILWEGFIPGNSYFDEADRYNWLRMEFMYRY